MLFHATITTCFTHHLSKSTTSATAEYSSSKRLRPLYQVISENHRKRIVLFPRSQFGYYSYTPKPVKLCQTAFNGRFYSPPVPKPTQRQALDAELDTFQRHIDRQPHPREVSLFELSTISEIPQALSFALCCSFRGNRSSAQTCRSKR